MTRVRIAQISCGSEYSGVQKEINDAAEAVDAEVFFPDLKLADIQKSFSDFGLDVKSPDLKLSIARAKALAEGRIEADAVFIATCFRCAEAAIVRNELRRFIHENSRLPVVSYSFTERTTSGTLLTRMEASRRSPAGGPSLLGKPRRASRWVSIRDRAPRRQW